jgi:hypothetical protein
MIDTNQLLNIAVVAISNLCQMVPVDQGAIVTNKSQIHIRRASPLTKFVIVANDAGYVYSIRDGVVQGLNNPELLRADFDSKAAKVFKTPLLNSNDAIKISDEVLSRLARGFDPLSNSTVQVTMPGTGPERKIPLCQIRRTRVDGHSEATLSLNAANARVVEFFLFDKRFYDTPEGRSLMARAIKDDPRPPPSPRHIVHPETNEVIAILKNAALFADQMGICNDSPTNAAAIDWERTEKFQDTVRVYTKDGAQIGATNRIVCYYAAKGALFAGPAEPMTEEEIQRFTVRIQVDWHDLAKKVIDLLRNKADVPPALLSNLKPWLPHGAPNVGELEIHRIQIVWVNSTDNFTLRSFNSGSFSAEVDLSTGEIMSVRIGDPKLIQYLSATQKN